MKAFLIRLYKRLFVRKALYRLNYRLLNISLWGLGILNSENDRLSGEDHFLRHTLKHGQMLVVLDIGANVGSYASKVKKLHPLAQVYAFEPHPGTFKTLQMEAALSGFQAFQLAFADVPGQGKLYNYSHAEGSAHASLYRPVIEDLRHAEATYDEIQISTVDQFLRERNIAEIDLLKIDTEGGEINVIKGARESIEAGSIKMIQFEFNEMNVISHAFFRDFVLLMPQYTFYRMLPDGLVALRSAATFVTEIFAFQNIVAIRG